MRVLFVTNLWPDSDRPWHGTFVRTQADSLAKAGVELDIFPIRGYAGMGQYARAARRALRLNFKRPYDVVHAHHGYGGLVARFQARSPLVISYTGSDLNAKELEDGSIELKSAVEAAVFRQLALTADLTITKSAAMAELLPAGARERNRVIPNGVNVARFKPVDKAAARHRLGWDPAERAVLYVGDPGKPWKGHALAESTVAELVKTVPEAKLRAAWQVPPGEIPVWMSAADALILPSRSEGSPNVVKEAMAAELPVVSTPVGDVAERLDGLPAGGVYDFTPEGLAGGLARAVVHGRLPEARERVARELSLERVAERVIEVYDEAIERRKRGHASVTVLFVASTGGHLSQLKALSPRFEGLPDEDRFWVTFDTPQSRSMLAGEDVEFVRHVYPRDFVAIVANTRTAGKIIRSRHVTAAVSTGSGVALSFFPIARAMGARCHYIESAARSTGPSVTGRILSRIPGIRAYTQYPSNVDSRWHYRGAVFDGYTAERVDSGPVRRVVVTVGTIDKYGFRRLLDHVKGLVGDDVEVFWQTGTADVEGLGIEPRVSVPASELMAAMRAADVVISHAGIGSALAALDSGHVPILVPRRSRYGEHVDDHQEQIAADLDRRGLALWREVGDLTAADLEQAAASRIRSAAVPTPFRLQA